MGFFPLNEVRNIFKVLENINLMTQLSFEGVLFFSIKVASRGLCLRTHFGGGRKKKGRDRKERGRKKWRIIMIP